MNEKLQLQLQYNIRPTHSKPRLTTTETFSEEALHERKVQENSTDLDRGPELPT